MDPRFLAFALLASLIVFGAASVTLSNNAYAQADNLWYPGEGVQEDMYVKYRIHEERSNNGQPYEMTMYFQEQNEDGWIVPTFVEYDQGSRVTQANLTFADNMQILAGGDIPPEMRTFISGYHGSLHWLDAVTTEAAPLSLTAASWGRTGSIGGPEIRPSGQESVTVPADTFDTTVISWHKSVTSKVWVLNEFPFPVKALAYADVTTGNPPVQFEFELLERGTGQPEAPVGTGGGEVPRPPLEETTRSGYQVRMEWTPVDIQPDSDVTFGITFSDNTGFPLQDVNYDLTIKDASDQIIHEFTGQRAELGTATHQVNFNSTGTMTVTVNIDSVGSENPGQFIESADFSVVVVPEFPVSAAVVAAVVIGLVVIMTRARGTGLGGLFGGRNAL